MFINRNHPLACEGSFVHSLTSLQYAGLCDDTMANRIMKKEEHYEILGDEAL